MHFLHIQKLLTAVLLILDIENVSVQGKNRNYIFGNKMCYDCLKVMETKQHSLLIRRRWRPYCLCWCETVCSLLQHHALFCVAKTNDKFDRFITFFYNDHWHNNFHLLISWYYANPIVVFLRSYCLGKKKGWEGSNIFNDAFNILWLI